MTDLFYAPTITFIKGQRLKFLRWFMISQTLNMIFLFSLTFAAAAGVLLAWRVLS